MVAVFCLWKETCCPDVIAFFKWFIRKVRVDRAISILYECREWACATSVYLLCKPLLCLAFVSALGSTGNAALWKAPCHLDSSSTEVNLRVVLVEPGHPKNHALLPKSCDCKQDAFGVAIVHHDHVDYFVDASSFIQHSIYVVNGDQLGQLSHWQFGSVNEIWINEVSSHVSIDHCFSGSFFHVRCLKVGQNHDL